MLSSWHGIKDIRILKGLVVANTIWIGVQTSVLILNALGYAISSYDVKKETTRLHPDRPQMLYLEFLVCFDHCTWLEKGFDCDSSTR